MPDRHSERLAAELRENGFDHVESGEVAISVRQLALLNWKNINQIKEEMITKEELKALVRYSSGALALLILLLEFAFHLTS
jgi:hypothetical protein